MIYSTSSDDFTLGLKGHTVPFQGFLDRWRFQGSALELRFASGNFEDAAKGAVLYVTVDAPTDEKAVEDRLSEVEPYETEVVVQDPTATAVTVDLDYGEPIVLRGKQVQVRQMDFEAEDYARLARLHHQSADLANDALNALNQRVSEARRLLEDQARRITEKAKRQKVDSTARTLYDQQLSFISRVIRKLET
jgi:hypothetical protein